MAEKNVQGPFDISNEGFRYYTYADGKQFRIEDPRELYIVDGSHRVIDLRGFCHRPERGYVGISWCQNDGKGFSF